jgi:hypothetical protein
MKGGAKECRYRSRRRHRKGGCVCGLRRALAPRRLRGRRFVGDEVKVVRGAGAEMSLNEARPDTKQPIVGALIPKWRRLRAC